MSGRAEKLTEVDHELAAFGKSDEELGAVLARARELASSFGDLDAVLTDLSDGREQAVARALAATPSRTTGASGPAVETAAQAQPSPEAGASPLDDELLRTNSSISGLSVDELFADAEPSAAPADHDSGVADLFDEEEPATGQLPSAEADPSLADLFEDEAEPAAPDSADESSLADLFEDEESLRLSDPEIEFESLEDQLEPESIPPNTSARSQPPASELATFADESTAEEDTNVVAPDEVDQIHAELTADEANTFDPEEAPSSEFEMLADEDLLDFDVDLD